MLANICTLRRNTSDPASHPAIKSRSVLEACAKRR